MSLVNQVLKDLEQRHASQLQEVDIGDLHYAPVTPAKKTRSLPWRILASILIVLGALSAAGVYVFEALDKKAVNVAKPVVVPAQPVTTETRKTEVAAAEVTPVKPDVVVPPSVKAPAVKPVVVAAAQNIPVKHTFEKTEVRAESPGTLDKRIVPISTQQRVELAYQEGYDSIKQHDYRKAESALRSALALEPAHLKAREMLAGVYISQGRWIEASEVLREGVSIAPQHHAFIKLYARTLMQLKRDAQAIEVLTRYKPAVAQDPDHYALLAALHQRQQQHETAAHMYSDILKLQPHMGIWWVGMGISLEAMGQQQQAVAAYQEARKTGTLNGDVARYTDNRLLALDAIAYPMN